MREYTIDDFCVTDENCVAESCSEYIKNISYDGKLNTWSVNMSDILTKLIHLAGRYCEHYASDLFIIWKYHNPDGQFFEDYKGEKILLGFRGNGVDMGENVVKNYNENRYYYRKLAVVDTVVDGNRLKSRLAILNS